MVAESVPSFDSLKKCLLDLTEPMAKRTRAVFYLRTRGGKEDLAVLLEALQNQQDSELMRHEIAYVIGQFQHEDACDVLSALVENTAENTLVRHEAAEALGAIGSEKGLAVLEKFVDDAAVEVAETCQLAVDLINYNKQIKSGELKEGEHDKNPYLSVDPAPAAEKSATVEELKETLLDASNSLFNRYRAMFSLRNRNTESAALALGEAFSDKSELFRHEIAYVMGQMENPATVPALKKVLEDKQEHRMVRHEAAEALGAIGTPECEELLKVYKQDEHQVVRESCEVALDAMDYWSQVEKSD